MAIKSGTEFSQVVISCKPLRWTGLLVGAVAPLMLVGGAEAQEVRSIQVPAPYNACNVRSAGGIQYSVVGTFQNGSSVTLLGESGRGWYRVQIQGVTGWMARQCLGL